MRLIIGISPTYFGSWSISSTIPLMVALVPTGIKTGVGILWPLSSIVPALAFPLVFCTVNFSFGSMDVS